ncbi:MAG: hypothetical protein LWW93_16330 [Hyphomicrobiales bacterium]|nr:hypothetical protein [Hyphomicrobiales bacterium]
MFATIGTLYIVKTYDRDGGRDRSRLRDLGATSAIPAGSEGGLSRTAVDPAMR